MAFGKKAIQEEEFETSSIIESGILIEGQKFSGSSNVLVRGIIKSKVELDADLTVDFEGLIEGEVNCNNIIIRGKILGNVTANGSLLIANEGAITGDISCTTLEVQAGGKFIGSCNQVAEPVIKRKELKIVGEG
ncbi:MAG: polymer-forming cytoskeletal protein [Defluviitaleaceae bacterium]|nr:polymer-forming cytoskeletal protein [Defluviitaleaceae bacterium]